MKLDIAIKQKQEQGLVPIIAEIKRCTPVVSKKNKKDMRSAKLLAKAYEKGGACAVSIVCEKKYFGGQPELDIPDVLNTTTLPVLIKDFILEKEQVDRYRYICSMSKRNLHEQICILLISHVLKDRLLTLARYSSESNMTPVIEIEKLSDLHYLQSLPPGTFLMGFNNRDIHVLEARRNKTELSRQLILNIKKIHRELLISESGHRTAEDVFRSIYAGADAVLIGRAIMEADNPTEKIRSLVFAQKIRDVL